MRKLLLLTTLLATPAFSADLPVKSMQAPAPVVATNPFFLGIIGGVGASRTENELTLEGTATGPLKGYPTGAIVGAVAGYTSSLGPLYWGASFEAAYDFSRGGVGCSMANVALGAQNPCLGFRKNGLLLQEGLELGISTATVMGYVPSSAQPQNWPVPITVPSSAWSNLIFAARGGVAERDVTLCATDDTGAQQCGSKFIVGPYVGAKLKAMLSAQTEVGVTYDHVFWNSSFTPAGASTLFANVTRAKSEELFKVYYGYHF